MHTIPASHSITARPWPFDLRTNACRATATSIKFDVDSSSCFLFREQTQWHTCR